MTPQEVEALLDRLAPVPAPAPLEERVLRAAAPPPPRRAFGIAAVAASALICLGVMWLIVAPPAPPVPEPAAQADVDGLVRAMGNDDIAVRDRASRSALERLRKDAAFLEAVKARLKKETDPEIRARLKGLIDEASEPPYRVKPVEKAVLDFNGTGHLCHAAFSSNGLRLAAVFFDGSMVLWSIPDAKELIRTNVRRQGQHVNCDLKRVMFSNDGRQVVLTDTQQRIAFYDAETLVFQKSIDTRTVGFSNDFPVTLHPGGAGLAWAEGMTGVVVAAKDGTVVARASLDNRLPKRGAQVFVTSLQYSADGKRLLAAGGHLAFLLDSSNLETVAVLEDYVRGIKDARFAGAEGYAVTRTSQGGMTAWDLTSREPVATAATGVGPGGTYHSMFHAAGPWVFADGGDQAQHLLAFRPKSLELIPLVRLSAPGEMAFVSPDGAWLLLRRDGEWKKASLVRMEPE